MALLNSIFSDQTGGRLGSG